MQKYDWKSSIGGKKMILEKVFINFSIGCKNDSQFFCSVKMLGNYHFHPSIHEIQKNPAWIPNGAPGFGVQKKTPPNGNTTPFPNETPKRGLKNRWGNLTPHHYPNKFLGHIPKIHPKTSDSNPCKNHVNIFCNGY